MSKKSTPKTITLDTTTLIFNFQHSDFQKLKDQLQIWEYDMPRYMRPRYDEDYAKNHIWARNETENPYYLNSPTLKLYIAYSKGELIKDISDLEGNTLPKKLFVDFTDQVQLSHIIKVLISCYVHSNSTFISNNVFYLLVDQFKYTRGIHNYASVLKIEPSLQKQRDIQNQHTQLYEFFLRDTATRLRRTEYSSRNPKYVPFDFTESSDGESIVLKPLRSRELAKTDKRFIYEEHTDRNYKTKVKFHSIESFEAYEKSRNYLLDRFTKGLISYMINLGFSVQPKQLNLVQVEKKLSENNLDFKNFCINVIDKRFNKSIHIQKIIDALNMTSYGSHFVCNPEGTSQEDNVIILMDYSKNDFDHSYLQDRKEEDGYKQVKRDGLVNSQGFCINLNSFSEKKIPITEEEFLDYKPLETDGRLNTDLERNFEICLQQLFLKSLISKPYQINQKLPYISTVENLVFVHCWTNDRQRFEKLCFVENQQLQFEDLKSEKSSKVLEKLGLDYLELILLWEEYNQHKKFSKGDIYFILSKEFVWEIQESMERALYPSEIGEVLKKRELRFQKSEFEIEAGSQFFADEQINAYNNFIANEVEDFVSYEELVQGGKKGKYRDRIFEILNISKETNFAKSLEISGKKAGGYLATSQGIWFDPNTLQYFVGSKNGYNGYDQETGFQLRKIIIHKGIFNEQLFFPLLNVDFVKYKSYTVLPYVFNLIRMYAKMNKAIIV